eukprot:2634618-Pyramimonas_sp.AAC.1
MLDASIKSPRPLRALRLQPWGRSLRGCRAGEDACAEGGALPLWGWMVRVISAPRPAGPIPPPAR